MGLAPMEAVTVAARGKREREEAAKAIVAGRRVTCGARGRQPNQTAIRDLPFRA